MSKPSGRSLGVVGRNKKAIDVDDNGVDGLIECQCIIYMVCLWDDDDDGTVGCIIIVFETLTTAMTLVSRQRQYRYYCVVVVPSLM